MKKIMKYHLEIFTAFVLIFTIINAFMFRQLSDAQKILNLFLLLGVLHEWEEKRYPGGFFDLMANKFKMKLDQATIDKAGCIVIAYWLLVTLIPFAFDHLVFLLLIPVVLNFFEAFIHTMGIVIHRLKSRTLPVWYQAGLWLSYLWLLLYILSRMLWHLLRTMCSE